MEGQLRELLQFLHDKNPQVRQIALTNLLGQTPNGSPHRHIFFDGIQSNGPDGKSENECIMNLKVLCVDQPAIAHDAFRSLVNLSDDSRLFRCLSEESFLTFIVSYIVHPPSLYADLASMLLSNITSSPSVCSSLLSLKIPVISSRAANPPFYPLASQSGSSPRPSSIPAGETKEVLAMPLLLQAFVQSASTDPSSKEPGSRKADPNYLANVFANLTTTTSGRAFFLSPRLMDVLSSQGDDNLEYPLSLITSFTEHPDSIRRGGAASVLKHCAFHVPGHKAMMVDDSESVCVPPSKTPAPGINVIPYILLPLAGPEEFDIEDQEKLHPTLQFLPDTKKRETNEMLRQTHLETLLMLSTTRAGRDCLRNAGVYEIIRVMHLSEKSESVADHIERLVNLLKGDEAPISETDEDDWSHPMIDAHSDTDRNAAEAPTAPVASSQTAGAMQPALDSDDEDSQIKEV